MKKYVEVQTAKEFALGFFSDPILRMAVNQLLDNVPAAEVTETVHGEAPRVDYGPLISWLRSVAAQSKDSEASWKMKKIASRMEALERSMRWIPAGKPPEDGMVVLVTDGRCVDSAVYDAAEDWFDVDHAFVDPNGITGWKSFAALSEVV